MGTNMNRNIIIAIIVIVAAGGIWWKSTHKDVETTEATTTAPAADTTAAATTTTAPAADAAVVLDANKFDATAVNAFIDASTADDMTKSTLKTAVTAAGTDPAAITAVIAQIKTALKIQ
jgi:hypothetical protein